MEILNVIRPNNDFRVVYGDYAITLKIVNEENTILIKRLYINKISDIYNDNKFSTYFNIESLLETLKLKDVKFSRQARKRLRRFNIHVT